MSEPMLKELDITNFRSIRGHIHAPLDAKVVLIHGENGAGKTSLLSAIELALTGNVQSLRRADPDYAKQLLHRAAERGSVSVTTSDRNGEQHYEAVLRGSGAQSISALAHPLASVFGERTYLPQSLLGQLLQIYQDSGSGPDSPLAKFVGDLLGLDRLDALEAGLKPLADVRNVRKVVDGWSQVEIEKDRWNRLLDDQQKLRTGLVETLQREFDDLSTICAQLQLQVDVGEAALGEVATALRQKHDEEALGQLTDRERRLASIRRELSDIAHPTLPGDISPDRSAEVTSAYAEWESVQSVRIRALRSHLEALLPLASLPTDHVGFGEESLRLLQTELEQLSSRVDQARFDLERLSKAMGELDVAKNHLTTIDEEILRIPSNAGGLSTVLSELSSYIDGDVCPVCDRNFDELLNGTLVEHVHNKVRRLSASAERLLALSRSRGEQQSVVERLQREIESLKARVIDQKTLADLDRRLTALDAAEKEVSAIQPALREGASLRAADVAARRAVSDARSRSVALAAGRETLDEFAASVGAPGVGEKETFFEAFARLEVLLAGEKKRLDGRIGMRRKADDLVSAIKNDLVRRGKIDEVIAEYARSAKSADGSLHRAQKLREQGNSIRGAVDSVRSAIIRREFNDRLNRVWRDLFVRLAPSEPFVPAFRIPSASTQRLQPRLITEHREGGEAGGAPGAMLSAGNLNTAALTLFIALHLSATKVLPWLILDDPVQSMDDVHIAHFAALLRTLSKEHGRQVMVAVHDRQLFEYLRLELSPAFADDSLLTLELSRSTNRDTLCIPQRLRFQQETALRAA